MSAIREALEAAQEALSDAENFWGLDFDSALRKIDTALATEAEKRIQSAASSSRDVTQPAGEAYSSRRTPLAAPFPHPQAHPSQAAAATQAMSAVTRVPPSSIDLESLAAWRESQGQPIDAEPRIR